MAMMKHSSGVAHRISNTSWGELKKASLDHEAKKLGSPSLEEEKEEEKEGR